MIKYCECGCGAVVNNKYVRGHHTKNKSYIEIYGKEKSNKLINNLKQYNKGQSFEKRFGKEKADMIKNKMSLKHKGVNKNKTLDEIHGNKKAEKIKLKQRKIKDTQQVIDVLKDIFKYEGNIMKMDFFNNCIVRKKLGTMNTIRDTLKKEKITIDEIAIQANIKFKPQIERIGKNEKQILDDIEKEKNIHLERQFFVNNFYIDGYDSINNIAYEVDELYHKYQQVKDIIRENKIKEQLDCKFIRINDF